MTPETRLDAAAQTVVDLYLGDQLAKFTDTPESQRELFWREVAQEFPEYTDKITGLRAGLVTAAKTRSAYNRIFDRIIVASFQEVQDPIAKGLLSEILWRKTSSSPGYVDNNKTPSSVASDMAANMGIEGGWKGEQAKSVTPELVVRKVLTGDLKIS